MADTSVKVNALLPLVSVVIPYYNRAKLIRRTLASVRLQSYKNLECIIVDDCSSAPCAEILGDLDDPRIRIVALPENRGAAFARNVGIRQARGAFVALLDSDDLWDPAKLEVQVAAALRCDDPRRALVFSPIRVERSGKVYRIPSGPPPPDLGDLPYLIACGKCIVQSSAMLVSREIAQEVLFDDELSRHQDFDFAIRAWSAGAVFVLLPEPLVLWTEDAPDRLSKQNWRSSLPFLDKLRRLDDSLLAPFLVNHCPQLLKAQFSRWDQLSFLSSVALRGQYEPRSFCRALAVCCGFRP